MLRLSDETPVIALQPLLSGTTAGQPNVSNLVSISGPRYRLISFMFLIKWTTPILQDGIDTSNFLMAVDQSEDVLIQSLSVSGDEKQLRVRCVRVSCTDANRQKLVLGLSLA